MRYTTSDKLIAWLTLFSGLTVSAVAIYYSVAGLVAIFAAAVIPIVIMGVALEASKLVATVWLKWNWQRAPLAIKSYLIIAISILMVITSMGIFGYLSKAHLDQAVPTGEVASKVELLDEKIKTQRDNITTARAALQQMDNQVNERLSRSTDDKGAERAVQIRRQQQAERAKLQKEIADAQATIAKLNEERAPIASELRKVEAEVGPIKYIAALIYGDTADATLLEAAVRWVIIIIVIVFDPLAVILLLASQYSFQWFRQEKEEQPQEEQKQKEEEQPLPEPKETEYVHSPWPFPVRETGDKFLEQEKDTLVEAEDRHNTETVKEEHVETPVEDKALPSEENTPEETTSEEISNEEINEEDDEHIKDEDIIDAAVETEKKAMKAWKHDNPNSSLKHYKRLLKKGSIDRLPWENYLQAKPDFTDEDAEAAQEAAKWAQEQIEKKTQYVQNSEQNESTLWQRIQDSKK